MQKYSYYSVMFNLFQDKFLFFFISILGILFLQLQHKSKNV